jgi:hypothetical protein
LNQFLNGSRTREVSWADPAGVMGVLVKVLDGGGAHHSETLL